ncbi:MAG: hypothetical protein IT531_11525 [Burkholderiales bacterium]|nr:hypothetical protein [Burkholderiales bacterium]
MAGVIVCALLQIVFSLAQPKPLARASELDPPPSGPALALMQGFEPLPFAHLLTLYLQSFDNQPGISIPYRDLNYERVAQWLLTALRLDPTSQYPLLMATQLYAQVPDPARSRYMLELAYRQFLADPNRRWRWLAHGAIMAKHRLKDLPLALKYAGAIAERSPEAPAWARQMHIFLLEDMGELDSARILLGGLLAGGQVSDAHERILLLESLERIKAAENSAGATKK